MIDYEIVDFKTVKLESKLDTGVGANLSLKAESRVSAKTPDEYNGYIYIYLNIKLHDEGDTYFLFDITTETIFKVDESIEPTDEVMEQLIKPTQERSFAAIRDISVAMGLNELDLAQG